MAILKRWGNRAPWISLCDPDRLDALGEEVSERLVPLFARKGG